MFDFVVGSCFVSYVYACCVCCYCCYNGVCYDGGGFTGEANPRTFERTKGFRTIHATLFLSKFERPMCLFSNESSPPNKY